MTKTKCLIVMYKISKNEIFGNFGPLIEHGSLWINFIILTFKVKKVNILDAHIKFVPNLFHLTWEKIVDAKKSHRFYEEKDEFGGPKNESLCFKWDTSTILRPKIKIQHDRWWQYAMTSSSHVEHSHNLLPQMPNFLFYCVHQSSHAQQKHTIPLYFTFSFMFLSSLLPLCLPFFYARLGCPFPLSPSYLLSSP